jgi:hypothetical protein
LRKLHQATNKQKTDFHHGLLGGVFAAWTYSFPGNKEGEKPHFEARLSRISERDQSDFTLPMPFWTSGINSLFEENMVLGEGDILYATNKHQLLRFHIPTGEVNWVRQPPTGEVDLQFAAGGGGLVVSNAGRLFYFDADGNGQPFPSTVVVPNPNDIGLAQFDLFDNTPLPPLQFRTVQMYQPGFFLAVEDGAPDGRGSIVFFAAQ